MGNKAEITRAIKIVDREKPILSIVGGSQTETVDASKTAEYNDEGATCLDYVHGNLNRAVRSTGDIVKLSEPGNYYVTYTCKDPSGNHAVPLTKTITVADITCPEISVQGEQTLSIEAGFPYSDLGFSCTDTFSDACTADTIGNNVNYANNFDTSATCKDVKARYNGAASGTYSLMLNEVATVAYCDMTYLRTYFASEDLSETCETLGLTAANWKIQDSKDSIEHKLPVYFLEGATDRLCSFADENGWDTTPEISQQSGLAAPAANAKDEAGNTAACADGSCSCAPKRTVIVVDTLPPVISLKLGDKLVAVSASTTVLGQQNVANPAYVATSAATSNPFLSLMAESTTQVNGFAVAAVASFIAGVALLSYTSKSSTNAIPV